MSRTPSRPGSLAVAELPEGARFFADLPFSDVTEHVRQYHLRTYERWCQLHNVTPWPPTLDNLLIYASSSAEKAAFFTVRERIRVVSMIERKRSGTDLYMHSTMQDLLHGIWRNKPPSPVQPLRKAQIDTLFAYVPTRAAQRNFRCLLLLSYCAGMTLTEHVLLRCELLRFVDNGVWIEGLPKRTSLFIGKAVNPARCPVAALRGLVGSRTGGPVYHSTRNQSSDGGYTYSVLASMVFGYGRVAGVVPLSNERVRLAGIIEQSRHIDIVRLAHFHGYAHMHGFAQLLGRHIVESQRYRYANGLERTPK